MHLDKIKIQRVGHVFLKISLEQLPPVNQSIQMNWKQGCHKRPLSADKEEKHLISCNQVEHPSNNNKCD